MQPFAEIPFPTEPTDKRGYEIFRTEIWHSRQVCNQCFSHIRNIGPEIEKWLGASYQTINAYYERTENGSQEFTPFDHNVRYGTCFCTECGSDCTGDHRNTAYQDIIPLVRNIYIYTQRHTDHSLDRSRLASEVSDLMSIENSTGRETEVMAIAFSRALETDQRAETAPKASA